MMMIKKAKLSKREMIYSRIQEELRPLTVLAQDTEYRFKDLYQFLSEELLHLSLHHLNEYAPCGRASIDVAYYKTNSFASIPKLHEAVFTGTYTPRPIELRKRFDSQKTNKKIRQFGRLHVEDKIVQTAFHFLLSCAFEPLFKKHVFGFRKGNFGSVRNAREYFRQISSKSKYKYLVKLDIKNFFPRINRYALIAAIKNRIACSQTINLLELWMNAATENSAKSGLEIMDYGKDGLIQGTPTAPILANIVLHYYYDEVFYAQRFHKCGATMRFVDDIMGWFETENEARTFKELITHELSKANLQLPEIGEKNKIISLENSKNEVLKMDYLGYTHEFQSVNSDIHQEFSARIKSYVSDRKMKDHYELVNFWSEDFKQSRKPGHERMKSFAGMLAGIWGAHNDLQSKPIIQKFVKWAFESYFQEFRWEIYREIPYEYSAEELQEMRSENSILLREHFFACLHENGGAAKLLEFADKELHDAAKQLFFDCISKKEARKDTNDDIDDILGATSGELQ